MTERRYTPSFSELCDRLSIVAQKWVYAESEDQKKVFTSEISDIVHDLDLFIEEGVKVNGQMILAQIFLTLANCHIFENEGAARGDGDKADLKKTHQLNSDRSMCKARISSLCNGRIDPKLQYSGGLWNFKFE